ncbi:MAG: indolepyruvate ferredoxin oxidoreductase subunit alpha [Actinobacteria bacterium]|nr:indolepyruvate ferredoxin oxidoreductase subunit alpha [Actinomycetota bacterium]
MKDILSGNEAIARGAWEAGVRFAAAYPGTPSTEILENIRGYEDIESQWSPNEKVATEVALGASIAGARSLAVMKHVGVNVAADPLFTASYTGVNGGFVMITADDPAMHSSQNEQDNRNYARFAKVPLLEPSDSQEAKDMLKLAFELSEEFDTPVLFRTTTRISHSKTMVELGERAALEPLTVLEKDVPKYTMLPGFARAKHPKVEQRILDLAQRAETLDVNRIEMGDPAVGIVASGVVYQYAREAFPGASFLKLGMTYPLPQGMVEKFRSKVDRLYVVEELDPFLEERIRLMGVKVDGGKSVFPITGELDPGLVARLLTAAGAPGADGDLLTEPGPGAEGLPMRPPTLCPGCSHRGVFTVLSRLKVFVSGDIGCYTLGAMPPFGAMHSCVCMGASIGMAHGISKVTDAQGQIKNQTVAVIGDSTFFHSGITGLMDTIWNRGASTTIILDNRTTAMTGGQETPGTGKTLSGEPAAEVDIPRLVEALGVKRIAYMDPYDLTETEEVIRRELEAPEPSVIIARAPCVLQFKIMNDPWTVDSELCNGCKRCLRVGCVALSLIEGEGEEDTLVEIDPVQCNGCGVCAQMCRFGAILPPVPVEA